MAKKVCLVTGAAGIIGQRLVAELVAAKRKVIALGDPSDEFSPEILKKRHIKVTTALPVTETSFIKHDVQFCFGDIGDISFLASILSTAANNGLEIEYVFHLAANATIQKTSPAAYFPAFSATANVLEVVSAYWQSHKKVFKGFFYAAESGKKASEKAETVINHLIETKKFPAVIYKMTKTVGAGYQGKTALTSLYRVMTPFKSSVKWEDETTAEENSTRQLLCAACRLLEEK